MSCGVHFTDIALVHSPLNDYESMRRGLNDEAGHSRRVFGKDLVLKQLSSDPRTIKSMAMTRIALDPRSVH